MFISLVHDKQLFFVGDMISCLNWLGLCENYSSVYNMRNWLGAVDELVVKKQASYGVCHIIFDNLDMYIRHLHHLTLPVLMFERHPTFHLLKTDEKSLEETLDFFDRDLLDLNLENSEDERRHFLLVIKTVLAHDVCKHIKKLKWITQHYERVAVSLQTCAVSTR